jgi:hypothetical protein
VTKPSPYIKGKLLIATRNATKALVLIGASLAWHAAPLPSHAFKLGDFLRGLAGGANTCNGRACFNPGTTYGEWRFSEVRRGSASTNCKATYEREIKYFSGDWKYRTQQATGDCPSWAIDKLREEERLYASERLRQCTSFIEKTYRQSVGNYVGAMSNQICPTYVSTGIYSKGQLDRLSEDYAVLFSEEQKKKAIAAERARATAEQSYQASLSAAGHQVQAQFANTRWSAPYTYSEFMRQRRCINNNGQIIGTTYCDPGRTKSYYSRLYNKLNSLGCLNSQSQVREDVTCLNVSVGPY